MSQLQAIEPSIPLEHSRQVPGSIGGIKVGSIFHPSDFSEGSEIAFIHALKIALATGANLNMLHAVAGMDTPWERFPALRETLVRWNLLPRGSSREAVGHLGIGVRKVLCSSSQPVQACLGFLKEFPADMVVLAVHQHGRISRWFDKPLGLPIARAVGEMALFIPDGVDGFVSREDGSVSIRNILIPVAGKSTSGAALETAALMIKNFQLPATTVTLLYVGTPGQGPAVRPPEGIGGTWNRVTRKGELADTILRTADELAADLIIMSGDGTGGFLDTLRGGASERVLRKTRCPVLSLPAEASLN